MGHALATLPQPILAFCRSGARSRKLVEMAGFLPSAKSDKVYDIVIVGGGRAGIATAASILKRNRHVSLAIVEPSSNHFYQPGWPVSSWRKDGLGGPASLDRSSLLPQRRFPN